MAKTNPIDDNQNYASNLTPQQKIAMSLYLAKEPISKLSTPYAGSPAIIGNDTMGYHSIYPNLYEGLKPQQMYSLMGLNSPKNNTTDSLSNQELSGTDGSLAQLQDKYADNKTELMRVLQSIFNIKSKDYNYASGQRGGFDNGGIVNA